MFGLALVGFGIITQFRPFAVFGVVVLALPIVVVVLYCGSALACPTLSLTHPTLRWKAHNTDG